jgi:hypothetical protein
VSTVRESRALRVFRLFRVLRVDRVDHVDGGPRQREALWVTVLFVVLTVVLTYPLSLHPGSTSITDDPDVHTMVWTLAWDVHALVHQPLAMFDGNIFHPYSRTLAFSENLLGSVVFAAPAIWLTGNPVLAMNVVALVSCALCGVGAYLLARRLGLSPAASILCGVIFAFSPARFLRFPQIHLTTIQWMPFSLAFLVSYLDHGRRRDLRWAIAFFTAQVLTSGHGAVYLTCAIAVLLAYRFAVDTPVAPMQRLRDAGVPGLLLLAPAFLIVPPYLQVQRELGLRRSLVDWETAPASFLASPTHAHVWVIERLFGSWVNDTASAFLFPGYLPLLLVLAALLPGVSRVPWKTVFGFVLLTLLALFLAIGPPLSLWPLVYWIPGFNFIRVPSRFFLLAMLGIAVLAGIGADRWLARVVPTRRWWVSAGAGLVMLVEFALVPLPVHEFRLHLPPIDRWLDSQPKPFAVVEAPVGPYTRYHSTYMLHSMAHWQKTVHGHSSLLPIPLQSLYADLRAFPDENTIRKLADLEIDYVVVHTDMYAPGEWQQVEQRLARFPEWFALRHVDGPGRVYAFGRAR